MRRVTVISLQKLISAVKVVDSLKRKPESLKVWSFFGKYDLWKYDPVLDTKLCDECLGYATQFYFWGIHLRTTFPYLEISDEDNIDVNVHPNCRCVLHRVTSPIEYLEYSQDLFK